MYPLSYYDTERGCPFFEKKKLLSAVRNFHPCIHSRDIYGACIACMASRCYRGCPCYRTRVHADANVEREYCMKVFVMKLPGFIAGITKAVLRIKK